MTIYLNSEMVSLKTMLPEENLGSTTNRVTSGAARGDCTIPLRNAAFSQAVFSIRAAHPWNTVPQSIRESPLYHSFMLNAKKWLVNTYSCQQ